MYRIYLLRNSLTVSFVFVVCSLFFSCREPDILNGSVSLGVDEAPPINSDCNTYELAARRDEPIPSGENEAYLQQIFDTNPAAQAIYYHEEWDYYFAITVLPPLGHELLRACTCSGSGNAGNGDFYIEISQPTRGSRIPPTKKTGNSSEDKNFMCFWCRIKTKACGEFLCC